MSLLEPSGTSRLVRIWRGKTRPVVGEAEAPVLTWLRNIHGHKPQFDNTDYACLLWLPEPLLPTEYPGTAADIYRLAAALPGGKTLIEQFAKIGKDPFYFLIGALSENGPCLAGVSTQKPLTLNVRGKSHDRTMRGFRPGKIPACLQAQRLFSSEAATSRIQVERVDPAWIHGRGKDARQKELASRTVILFGCGSVGAPILHQLVMAGIGRLFLVDPEALTWANIGRHPLGARHVDKKKATELAELWQADYPHAHIEGFPITSHEFLERYPEHVKAADLILCATADWNAERELNFCHIAGETTAPGVYIWTEPHACAGHAVAIFRSGPCLQCGFTDSGDSKLELTAWPRDTEQTEPGCGAVFQPYGPVELMGTIALGAALALDVLLGKVTRAVHRIWAGAQSVLSDSGGSWTTEWINGDPSRNKGGFQEEHAWEEDPVCSACGASDQGTRLSIKSETQNSDSSLPPLS